MNDAELKKAFGKLAAQDAAAAPVYSRPNVEVQLRADGTRQRRRVWFATGSLVVATAAAVMFATLPREELLELDLSYQEWVPATDFLLNTPGRSLLSSVPEIGVIPAPVETPPESRIDSSRKDQ